MRMSVRNAFITLVAAGTAAAQIGGIDKNLNGEQGEFIAGTRGQVAKHVTEEVVDELDEAPQTSVSHDTFLTEQVTVQFPFSPGFAPDEPSDVSDLDLSGNTAYNIKAALESSAKQITRDEKVPKDLSIRKAIKLIRANGGLKADVDVHIQGRSGPLALLNEEADALRKQTRYDTNRILARERLREVDDFIVGNVKAGV